MPVSLVLEGWAREMLERPGMFGTLATLSPDGSPHLAVLWYEVGDDGLLVNSRVGRRWPTNLLRDPRYSFMVEAGYEWVSVRGLAEARPDPVAAQADIARLARRYHEPEEAERLIRETFEVQRRISFLLRVEAIAVHPDA
jgi:PPOX class probable F420-dependent enzyme